MKIVLIICFLASNIGVAGRAVYAFQQPSRHTCTSCSSLPLQKSSVPNTSAHASAGSDSFEDFDYMAVSTCTSYIVFMNLA